MCPLIGLELRVCCWLLDWCFPWQLRAPGSDSRPLYHLVGNATAALLRLIDWGRRITHHLNLLILHNLHLVQAPHHLLFVVPAEETLDVVATRSFLQIILLIQSIHRLVVDSLLANWTHFILLIIMKMVLVADHQQLLHSSPASVPMELAHHWLVQTARWLQVVRSFVSLRYSAVQIVIRFQFISLGFTSAIHRLLVASHHLVLLHNLLHLWPYTQH